MGGSVLYEFSIGRPILTKNLLLHFFGTPFSRIDIIGNSNIHYSIEIFGYKKSIGNIVIDIIEVTIGINSIANFDINIVYRFYSVCLGIHGLVIN